MTEHYFIALAPSTDMHLLLRSGLQWVGTYAAQWMLSFAMMRPQPTPV